MNINPSKAFKTVLLALSAGLLFGWLTACAVQKPVSATVAVIPNQKDSLDGQVYRGLRDVQAAVDAYKKEVESGFQPSTAMALDMADVIGVYNDVYDEWVLYHNAVPSQQHNTAAAMLADYSKLLTKYSAALSSGAPLPATSTIGAK